MRTKRDESERCGKSALMFTIELCLRGLEKATQLREHTGKLHSAARWALVYADYVTRDSEHNHTIHDSTLHVHVTRLLAKPLWSTGLHNDVHSVNVCNTVRPGDCLTPYLRRPGR